MIMKKYMSIEEIIKNIDSGKKIVLTKEDKNIFIYKTSGIYKEQYKNKIKIIKNINNVLFKYLQHGWVIKFEANLCEMLKKIR